MVCQITCRKDAGNSGLCCAFGDLYIPATVRFQLILDQLVRRCVANGDKDPFRRDFRDFAGFGVLHAHTFDPQRAVTAKDFVNLMEPERFDLGVLEKPILQDFFRAQLIAAVHQCHLRGEIRQEERLFHGRVPATNDNNFLTTIEKTVACRTGADAETLEFFFRWQPQPFCTRAGAQDHSVGRINCPAVTGCCKWPVLQIQRGDNVAHDFATHGAGVGLHADHQIGALHLSVTGPVFNLGGRGQLTPRFNPLDQNRLQHRARRIDTSGIARGARSDDQYFDMSRVSHGNLI